MKLVSKDEEDRMIELYQNGRSAIYIGKELNRDNGVVYRHLKKRGIAIRSNKINSRKHFVKNEEYFSNIDSSNKAYLLGFIYADGFISLYKKFDTKRFGMSLNSKDEYVLDFIQEELQSDYPINRYQVKNGYKEGTHYSRLLITNDRITNDLKKAGVFELKTSIVKPPHIDKRYYSDFIRGYVDGDGSINISNQDQYSIYIVGTNELLTWIGKQFNSNGLTDKRVKLEKRKEGQTVSYIRYGGNFQTLRILDYLYDNDKFSLKRKKERYLQLKKQCSSLQK